MIDLSVAYRVVDAPAVAWRVLGFVETPNAESWWSGELDVDESRVRAVMIGDDRVEIIDVDDLVPLDDEEFCRECGQLGCGHGAVIA